MIPRPHYHFTPPQNFLNDPNGLVFYDGEYHLFYQYNPFGNVHEHMSWGHAISRDHLHWEHRPVALQEENGIEIFSGSAVVDWNNTSGFGAQDTPPLIAIYTGHGKREQTQNIAYSTDRGRTWTKYADNPVIAIGSTEFRDPKVFWHEPSRQWIMLTVLADQHKIRFDASTDLKRWTHLSDFGPAGKTDGAWECPDLFQLAVVDHPKQSKWVLKVDVQYGIGAQCFIGEFDGKQFTSDTTEADFLQVDYGKDFYAAQSWSDSPDGRRIWIGWMNNWDYANVIPTSPWRGLFSIPRELSLRQYADELRLVQRPIAELEQLRHLIYRVDHADIATVNAQLAALNLNIAEEIKVEFTLEKTTEFGIKIRTSSAEETLIGYDAQTKELFVDRTRSGDNAFSPKFAGVHRAPLAPEQGKISMHIFVDSCSVEVFGNDGCAVISDLIFPNSEGMSMEFYTNAQTPLNALYIWELK